MWDSDDDILTIGDGSSRKTIFPSDGLTWIGSDTTERSTTSTSTVTLSTITVSVVATTPIMVTGLVRKTAGAAAVASLGLKLNATQVIAEGAVFSATDRAEYGYFEFIIPPRLGALYPRTTLMRAYTTEGSGGTPETTRVSAAETDMPTASITSVIITGTSGSASVTLAVDEIHVYKMGVA